MTVRPMVPPRRTPRREKRSSSHRPSEEPMTEAMPVSTVSVMADSVPKPAFCRIFGA